MLPNLPGEIVMSQGWPGTTYNKADPISLSVADVHFFRFDRFVSGRVNFGFGWMKDQKRFKMVFPQHL